jgi:very-short-patch-repair endonuclease
VRADDSFWFPFPILWGRGQGLGLFRLLPFNGNHQRMPALTLREQRNPELMRRATELRRRMTPEERLIWQELRGNRLAAHFRRQQVLAPYIVDFYCHAARLVVEIDGSPHRAQQGYDRVRDDYFMRCGIRVLRLSNVSVRDDLASVIVAIRAALGRQSPNP